MKDLKDTFEFELSKPLQNIHSGEQQGTFITCDKLYLDCTSYKHSVIEIELEQLFLDAQLTLAGKTERLLKPEGEQDSSDERVATEKENEDIVKLAYLAGGVSIPKLFDLFRKLFCGNNPVCFVDKSKTPLNKDDFERLSTKDKKNLVIKYTAVFFIQDWL